MNPQNHGFKPSTIEPDHFVHGDGKLGDAPVLTDGNWTKWLPAPEDQNRGFEPFDCVTEATLHVVETLIKQEYGLDVDLSVRFLAYATGTQYAPGNDPQSVMEFLRKKGNVHETDWPYNAPTFADFYSAPPQSLYTLALEFLAEYNYGHSWVVNPNWGPPDQATLMAALNFSPLTASVFAWAQDENGLYYMPAGTEYCHYIEIVNYVPNQYWVVRDSYSPEDKKLRWDFPFAQVKRHTIHRQIVNETAWQKFLQFMQQVKDGMQSTLKVGDYSQERTLGAERDPRWGKFKRDFESTHPKVCAVCGGTSKVQLHHQRPFHLHPELELDPQNVIWLCEDPKWNCHLKFGHFDNFRTKYNPTIKEESVIWNKRFNADSEAGTV